MLPVHPLAEASMFTRPCYQCIHCTGRSIHAQTMVLSMFHLCIHSPERIRARTLRTSILQVHPFARASMPSDTVHARSVSIGQSIHAATMTASMLPVYPFTSESMSER